MAEEGSTTQPGGPGPDDEGGDLGEVRGGAAEEGLGQEDDGEAGDEHEDRDAVLIVADVLDYLAKALVDDPDAVRVEYAEDDKGVVLRLHVGPDDMGKVIGRGGRTARAMRTIVRVAGARDGIGTLVEIVE